jgi:hypothetical protein
MGVRRADSRLPCGDNVVCVFAPLKPWCHLFRLAVFFRTLF